MLASTATTQVAGTMEGGGLWTSTDGGDHWTRRDNGITGVSVFYCLDVSGSDWCAGTDTGLWVSHDTGGTWTQLGYGLGSVMGSREDAEPVERDQGDGRRVFRKAESQHQGLLYYAITTWGGSGAYAPAKSAKRYFSVK